MTRRIHLIEKGNWIEKVEGRIHETKFWNVPTATAEELVGGDIYFHKKQKEPSFFGGKILGYRVHDEDDPNRGRVVFRFEYSPEHRNVTAGEGGWSYEKKIV